MWRSRLSRRACSARPAMPSPPSREFGPEVERVEEDPAGGEVGAGFDRGDAESGMERAHQQVGGPQAPGPAPQLSEVGEVADAPALGGSGGIELHREPEATMLRKVAAGRGHDQRSGTSGHVQPVVAERKIGGEAGPALPPAAVFELDLRRRSHRPGLSLDHHQRCLVGRRRQGRIRTQAGESRPHRLRAGGTPGPVGARVVGDDPPGSGVGSRHGPVLSPAARRRGHRFAIFGARVGVLRRAPRDWSPDLEA